MLRNNPIIQKLIKYRYFGYLAIGGFIIFFLFIANFSFVTDFEAVTSLTVSERSATIAKALPAVLGMVLLSIIAIFFIVFELHLKLKLQGLKTPLHRLAEVEKGIVNQLSVDSDRLKAEKDKQKELDKFEIPEFKPGEPIEAHPTQSLVTQIISKGKKEEKKVKKNEKKKEQEDEEDDEPEEKPIKKVEKKKVKKTSWFKSKLSALEKTREEKLKNKHAVRKKKLEELKKKREELLKHKKHIEKTKVMHDDSKEKLKQKRMLEMQKKNKEQEKLKQRRILEKQNKKEEKDRLKKARRILKQKTKAQKERKLKLEQRQKERQKQLEEKKRLLEQKKREQAKRRQKYREKRRSESFYRSLKSEFNSIDKELDDLLKRSKK